MGLLGVDPFISVNAGFGDEFSAAQLVEYANGAATTPMGKLRAANGHPAPYNIKWWGIGNEMYGSWQFGHMAMSQYVFKHNMFAEAMRKVDPSITLLATGATPDEMTIYGLALPTVGKLIPDFLSPGDWDGGLFTHCFDAIDVMSEHFYSYAGQRFDASGHQAGRLQPRRLHGARGRTAGRMGAPPGQPGPRKGGSLRRVSAAHSGAQEPPHPHGDRRMGLQRSAEQPARSPGQRHGASGNVPAHRSHQDGRAYHGDVVNRIQRHGIRAQFHRAASSSSIATTSASMPVEVGGDSPVPAPLYPVGGDQPKVNAGSPTYPVDVVAALTADGKFLTIAVINANESAQDLDLTFKGIDVRQGSHVAHDRRQFERRPRASDGSEIRITETALSETPKSVTIAPFSIDIYELEKR